MRLRALGVALIASGLVGLLGTTWAFVARSGPGLGLRTQGSFGGVRGAHRHAPALPRQTVDVILSKMGGMMGGGHDGERTHDERHRQSISGRSRRRVLPRLERGGLPPTRFLL